MVSDVSPKLTGYADVCMRGRQAGGLICVTRWLRATGLRVPDMDSVLDHLWQWMAIESSTLNAWHDLEGKSDLLVVGVWPDDPLPADALRAVVGSEVSPEDFHQVLTSLVQITYDWLFCGTDRTASLDHLVAIRNVTLRSGIDLPAAASLGAQSYADNDWGRPSPRDVARWWQMAAD